MALTGYEVDAMRATVSIAKTLREIHSTLAEIKAMMNPQQNDKLGPVKEGDPLMEGVCAACRQPFHPGQYVTLVAIGPGVDPEAQAKAREGQPYNAVALPAHWACVTGEVE